MELTEEKLSEALKLGKERCELTRLANEKSVPGLSLQSRPDPPFDRAASGRRRARRRFKEAEETLKSQCL